MLWGNKGWVINCHVEQSETSLTIQAPKESPIVIASLRSRRGNQPCWVAKCVRLPRSHGSLAMTNEARDCALLHIESRVILCEAPLTLAGGSHILRRLRFCLSMRRRSSPPPLRRGANGGATSVAHWLARDSYFMCG